MTAATRFARTLIAGADSPDAPPPEPRQNEARNDALEFKKQLLHSNILHVVAAYGYQSAGVPIKPCWLGPLKDAAMLKLRRLLNCLNNATSILQAHLMY